MAVKANAELGTIVSKVSEFIGGLNVRDPINLLAPNDLIRCQNVIYDSLGGLAKRQGLIDHGPYPDGMIALNTYPFIRGNGQTPHLLVHTTGGNLYYAADPTVDGGTFGWTLITDTLDPDKPASFETFGGICYFCEGSEYSAWDGVTYTNYPDAPVASYCRVWQDTMWLAGDPLNPDTLYASTPGDPTTFDPLAFVKILEGDGDEITGLFDDGQFLCVGKLKRIQVVFDPALFSNRTADFEKGLESHFSVVHLEDKLFYMSRLGICMWQGDAPSRLISYKVDRLFAPDIIDFSKTIRHAHAYTHNGACGWILPETNPPDDADGKSLILEYYPRFGPVYPISGNIGPGPWVMHRMGVSCFATLRPTERPTLGVDNEVLYAGGTTADKYYQMFAPIGTDDGDAYKAVAQTAFLDFGDPMNQKYLRRMRVVGRGKFNFQIKREFSNAAYQTKQIDLTPTGVTGQWGTGVWGTGLWASVDLNNIQSALVQLDAYGRVFSFYISDFEDDDGDQAIPIGENDAIIAAGQWAFYETTIDATLLGLRR